MRSLRVFGVAVVVFLALGTGVAGEKLSPVGSWEGRDAYKLKISGLGKSTGESWPSYIWVGENQRWNCNDGGGTFRFKGRSGRKVALTWDYIDQDAYLESKAVKFADRNGGPDLGDPETQVFVTLTKGKGSAKVKKGDIIVFKSTVKFTVTSALHPGKTWKGSLKLKQSSNRD